MSMQIDKEKLPVDIYTNSFHLEGNTYIYPGSRVTDMMSSRDTHDFIPLTDVIVYSISTGEELFRSDFLNLNKQHIVMVYPKKTS